MGASWAAVDSGLTNPDVDVLAATGTNLFAGTAGGVFLSTNNGSNWTAVNNGLTLGIPWEVASLAFSETDLFAGTVSGGVFLSTNNGENWTAVNSGLTNMIVPSLAVSGTNVIAGTYGGIFLSTNGGASWAPFKPDIPKRSLVSFAVSGTNIFAGTDSGLYLSANNVASWSAVNSGLPDLDIRILAVGGPTLFAGTPTGIWSRPLSEMIPTSVSATVDNLPSAFSLDQNYPNPFNPTTTIRYALPSRAHVSLTVYNTLGQQVASLVDAEQEPGEHSVRFDGSGLASGVYFYRLQAASFVQAKKLLILR